MIPTTIYPRSKWPQLQFILAANTWEYYGQLWEFTCSKVDECWQGGGGKNPPKLVDINCERLLSRRYLEIKTYKILFRSKMEPIIAWKVTWYLSYFCIYWKSTDESNILLGLLFINIYETLPTSTLVTTLWSWIKCNFPSCMSLIVRLHCVSKKPGPTFLIWKNNLELS